MYKVTKGTISYYCEVHGYVDIEGVPEIRLEIINEDVGEGSEVLKVVVHKDFFEVYNYEGYTSIYSIRSLVSVSHKLECK